MSETQVVLSTKKPLCAAFYLEPSDGDQQDWLTGALGAIGARRFSFTPPVIDADGVRAAPIERVAWAGLTCEVLTVDTPTHQVLALVFGQGAVLDAIEDPDRGRSLAAAFGGACTALGVDVGILLSRPVEDLPTRLAEWADLVALAASESLLWQRPGLVYLSTGYAKDIDDALRGQPARDELSQPNGRLIFPGHGEDRWW